MHTAASDCILSATGRLTLDDTRAEGVRVSHLEQIRQCNASGVALHVVGVDTQFDASDQNGTNRRPVLRLIGVCYVDSVHRTVMISVDMKIAGRMALRDLSCVKGCEPCSPAVREGWPPSTFPRTS